MTKELAQRKYDLKYAENTAKRSQGLAEMTEDVIAYLQANKGRITGLAFIALGDPTTGLYDPQDDVVSVGCSKVMVYDSLTEMQMIEHLSDAHKELKEEAQEDPRLRLLRALRGE